MLLLFIHQIHHQIHLILNLHELYLLFFYLLLHIYIILKIFAVNILYLN